MNVILTALEEDLANAWSKHCGHLDGVRVHRGSVFDADCDALVSPSNSFGFMDGGIDLAYSKRFGWGLQKRLQSAIREHHNGELLVGTAEIVDTDDPAFPYLIAAPTMRVPMILRETVNPYLAARAALLLVLHGTFKTGEHAGDPVARHVETVGFPGLGTGVGRVSPEVCAAQMAAAIADCSGPASSFPASWDEAQKRHQLLYCDRARALQFE